MEEPKREIKEIDEQDKFLDLLKDLADVQTQLAKINAQLALRKGKDQISNAVDRAKVSLEEKAKAFGANINKIKEKYIENNSTKKGIFEEYKDALKEIDESYNSSTKDVLEKIEMLESLEQQIMLNQKQNKINIRNARREYNQQEKSLKDEIIRATKAGDLDTARNKIDELQGLSDNNKIDSLKTFDEALQTSRLETKKLIDDFKEQYDLLIDEKEQKINEVTQDKDNKLANIQKQNFFQKFLGSIFNKFNGTKKFMRTAIEPLQSKIADIKTKDIPQIKQAISEKGSALSERFTNGINSMEENAKNKTGEYSEKLAIARQNIANKLSTLKSNIESAMKDVKQNAGNKKDEIVGTVKDTLETTFIHGLETKDKIVNSVKDTLETGQIYGLEAKDTIKNAIKDKIDTTLIYGLEAKDAIIARKNKIIDGVKTKGKALGGKVQGIVSSTVNKSKDTYNDIKEKGKDAYNDIKEKGKNAYDNVKNKGKNTYRSIIEKGRQAKLYLIQKTREKLNEKQAELEEKMGLKEESRTPEDKKIETEILENNQEERQ